MKKPTINQIKDYLHKTDKKIKAEPMPFREFVRLIDKMGAGRVTVSR